MNTLKHIGIWLLGLTITLAAAKYQRTTGPTYPYKSTVGINGQEYELEFVRSGSSSSDTQITLPISDKEVVAVLKYRRFPTNERFISDTFKVTDKQLEAFLPSQPMAGKLEYFVELKCGDELVTIPHQVIRFKGDVPTGALLPHILFIFIAMFFSNVAGLYALFHFKQFKPIGSITLLALLLGGMILGPVVQKYAFGEFWTGIPKGWDLTDNKTLIAFVFWIMAFIKTRMHPSRTWTIVAALVMLIIFAIPHSMFGSELDPETGKITQGVVLMTLIKAFKNNRTY